MIELENVFKPKKRVFVSLTLASAVIGAMVIYMAWRVALPGLEQINAKLPVVFCGIGIAIALALLAGVAGIVLAILGVPGAGLKPRTKSCILAAGLFQSIFSIARHQQGQLRL